MNHEHNIEQLAHGATASTLTLLFDGLFFICFNKETDPATECQVGFVTTAPDHEISINIFEAVNLGEGEIEESRYSINLNTSRARRIGLLELDVPGVMPSVTRKGHRMSIDRQHPNDENKEFFKWIIDLENSDEMHTTPLTLIPNVLKPVLKITTGEFYTVRVSQEASVDNIGTARKYERIQGNTKHKDFGAVAELIGVRINSLPQDKAFLKVGELILPLVRKAGTGCIVHFRNRRPESHTKGEAEQPHVTHSSDFPHFYHAFTVNPLERFDFMAKKIKPDAFPPAVCYSSTGSKTPRIIEE
ncbi:MAG: hypothetical protein H7Y30_09805 [Pyrinomonadaceae bacterium]|nr:hypothetical protein [Pyrinomonadaceae bacterium]